MKRMKRMKRKILHHRFTATFNSRQGMKHPMPRSPMLLSTNTVLLDTRVVYWLIIHASFVLIPRSQLRFIYLYMLYRSTPSHLLIYTPAKSQSNLALSDDFVGKYATKVLPQMQPDVTYNTREPWLKALHQITISCPHDSKG